MNVFSKKREYSKYHFSNEAEFEENIVASSKSFFGDKTIYINAKKKIDSKSLGGTIPDGFFFDLSDLNDPKFYLVEVELASHSFFNHIFPQITKFFGFYKNQKQQKALIEKLFTIINEDVAVKTEFKKYIGQKESYKFLTDILDNSQNILLILDGEMKELPEIIDTYTDTWGRMVKPLVIQKYVDSGDVIYTMEPEFEALEYIEGQISETTTEISEDYHLKGVQDNVKQIYQKIKEVSKDVDSEIVFNPQRYYISIKSNKNICFIKLRKKKIRLIAMLGETPIREVIENHPVKSLSEAVQRFYNGPCAAIDIVSLKNFGEIKTVIQLASELAKSSLTSE